MNHGGGESTSKSESGTNTSSDRPKAEDFSRAVSKMAVAQICESVGFQGFKDSALEAVSDIAIRYICDLGKTCNFQANLACRTECNLFDIIRGIEDLEVLKGFMGAAEIGKCLVGSGIVREIIDFVESKEEISFAQPIPQYPVVRSRKLIPSFEEMNETPPGKHIPSWLPAFPDPHTYIHTPMWNERKADPRADKIELARQRRKAEMALLSLQQRLVCNGETGTSVSRAANDEEEELPKTGSNPFFAKPLQSGEKDMSPFGLPAKLKDKVPGGNHVSVMEAFAPAIEAAKVSGFNDDAYGDRRYLPDKRPTVHFKFRTCKKFLGEILDSSLQKKGDTRSASFWRDEEKDDKKRRAELILKQSIENPQELFQL